MVDTNLFRVYAIVNPGLIGPLMRIKNYCEPEIVEELLKLQAHYKELLDFYYGRGMHESSLELLRSLYEGQQGDEEASTRDRTLDDFRTLDPLVRYLKRLDGRNIALVLQNLDLVLREDKQLVMSVLQNESPEAESLPPEEVADWLRERDKSMAIEYCQYVLKARDETSPRLHTMLALLYMDNLREHGHNEDSKAILMSFLESSEYYDARKLTQTLRELSHKEVDDVRALLYARQGKISRALETIVHVLHDDRLAERCCTVWIKGASQQVQSSAFHTLLSLYLEPEANPTEPGRGDRQHLEAALELLNKHGTFFKSSEAIELLPASVKIARLDRFVKERLEKKTSEAYAAKIRVGSSQLRAIETQDDLVHVQSRSVRVAREQTCPACHKRLGQSVLSIFPE